MKTLIFSIIFAIFSVSLTNASMLTNCDINNSLLQFEDKEKIILAGVTCFKSGEQTSGMNKICYYNCLGSTKAITISSTSLCPLTITD